MGTINHRLAALNNVFIAMECEKEHPTSLGDEFPFWLRGRNAKPVPDWDKVSNVCKSCNMSKSVNGTCPGCE